MKANAHRTVLLEADDPNNEVQFRVEKWFIVGDSKEESLVRIAMIWAKGDTEYVALLGKGVLNDLVIAVVPYS